MLIAYCDETGIEDCDPYVVWGGYAAPSEVWVEFNSAWRSRLAKVELDHFHMSEFKARRDPFFMKEAAALSLEHDLSLLIVDHKLEGRMALVDRHAWDALVVGEYREQFGDSIAVGFNASAAEFLKLRDERFASEEVALVYGEGRLKAGLSEAIDTYGILADRLASAFAGVSFKPMKSHPGIQAADMLIWEFQDQIKRAVRAGGTAKTSYNYRRLTRGGLVRHITYDRRAAEWHISGADLIKILPGQAAAIWEPPAGAA